MLNFIKEHKSWLLFIIVFNILLNVIWYLDEGLVMNSLLYINLIYYGIFFLFCIVRYNLDQQLYKDFENKTLSPIQQTIATHYLNELHVRNNQFQQMNWQQAEMHDELLAWVHDMKSPLTAMKLMIDSMTSGEAKRKLENEWLRIYLLLDQQLHITRLQTIEHDSRYERIELKQIIVSEVKALQPWCMEKGIGVDMQNINQSVKTDAKWLAFIIRQYLTNAIKYSDPDKEIIISTAYTKDHHLLLKIEDEGQTIAPHDLPRVFKKSYTGTKGRESASASGMGLYLAKQAAEAIGVKLYLEPTNLGVCAIIQFSKENEYTSQLGM